MKYRVLTIIALLILGTTWIYAQEITTDKGIVIAEGDGTIALNGSGEVIIEGSGVLFIVDRTDTATIEIESTKRIRRQEKQTRGNTVYIYHRFNGTATIKGDDIAVVMDGLNISVSVSGTGTMLVAGDGIYTVNTEDPQPWLDEGVLITIGDVDP